MKQDKINLDFFEPQVMAILNVTPDSFYSDSRRFEAEQIEQWVVQAVAQGASIIDVGGYSSRPNADDIPFEEEWRRVDMAMEIIRRVAPQIVISLDTFRSGVAECAIEKFGAIIINDISAAENDPAMLDVVARYKVPYLAMHMRGVPQTMQQMCSYDNVVEEVIAYFKAKIEQLKSLGIEDIIIDPGFGFAKELDDNYRLMASLDKLCKLGCPVLVGISRKSMIYKLLNCSPQESLSGTIALNWEALRRGATILRVHDVAPAVDCIRIFKKIIEV